MDLILWRHAEAHPLREGQSDLERRLTANGERQARRMGVWLQQHLPATTKVLVSPAARTLATADALERRYRIEPLLAPEERLESLLAAAQWPDAVTPVLVVGHQPTLGLVASQLLTGAAQSWSVKKAGVWWLRSRMREGVRQTVLHAVIGPDLLGRH
jgi:phosphohistidine phosphatase